MRAGTTSNPEVVTTIVASQVGTPRETLLELTLTESGSRHSSQKESPSDKRNVQGTPERAKTPLPAIRQEPYF